MEDEDSLLDFLYGEGGTDIDDKEEVTSKEGRGEEEEGNVDVHGQLNQRVLTYTVADERMKEDLCAFIRSRRYDEVKGWDDVASRRRKLSEWSQFILEYFRTGGNNVDDLPENWSDSEVFPVVNIATVGDAGTGKTISMLNVHSTTPGITITGPVNKSSDSYLRLLNETGQPFAYNYLRYDNTWYKHLKLQYQHAEMDVEFNKRIPGNEELQASFKEILDNTTACNDRAEVRRLVRNNVKVCLKALHKVALFMLESRKKEFLNYGHYIYRLNVDDEENPFFQSLDDTFPFVRTLVECQRERITSENGFHDRSMLSPTRQRIFTGSKIAEKETMKSILKRNTLSNVVKTQGGYRRFVMAIRNEFTVETLPPTSVLNEITLAEEDGRSPGIMKTLHSLNFLITSMIWNPLFGTWGQLFTSPRGATLNQASLDRLHRRFN